ncbi:hypothetical protein JQ557_08580 [Bradyrhizobium sp. U87765 SZCCT0131]|nr:hypothetical protein [Bradyrhizobium sp. U87765 SZCCT0131]MBR1261013.1 hypothetical protein [Bradyrhizobium sp. U87765 SZCCT0134]MBR1303539.1 hypothetical protein [Bradyrhizobium sp. U87765 SZCCT0110]MBR1319145.1 hypothetical protein [Bradyrhizobium sp. U87765 SZCCT0109]MBR1347470.1 hypothetical protein [Bradyrhizobium sp. U87765 SZCCT0048]
MEERSVEELSGQIFPQSDEERAGRWFIHRALSRRPVGLELRERQADLIGEGLDAAIGGSMELEPGVIAQRLAPLHVIAVASPEYLEGRLKGRTLLKRPHELAAFDRISMRSPQTARVHFWKMRHQRGRRSDAGAKGADRGQRSRSDLPRGLDAFRCGDDGRAICRAAYQKAACCNACCPIGTPISGQSRSTMLAGNCCPRRSALSSTT